jgi:hypothetical protein
MTHASSLAPAVSPAQGVAAETLGERPRQERWRWDGTVRDA